MIDHATYDKISTININFSNFNKSTETLLSPSLRNFIVNSIQIRLYNNIHREVYHNLKDQLEYEIK
jgi:hypothetical protein